MANKKMTSVEKAYAKSNQQNEPNSENIAKLLVDIRKELYS